MIKRVAKNKIGKRAKKLIEGQKKLDGIKKRKSIIYEPIKDAINEFYKKYENKKLWIKSATDEACVRVKVIGFVYDQYECIKVKILEPTENIKSMENCIVSIKDSIGSYKKIQNIKKNDIIFCPMHSLKTSKQALEVSEKILIEKLGNKNVVESMLKEANRSITILNKNIKRINALLKAK